VYRCACAREDRGLNSHAKSDVWMQTCAKHKTVGEGMHVVRSRSYTMSHGVQRKQTRIVKDWKAATQADEDIERLEGCHVSKRG
jgi:hypothetical protein